MATSAMVEYQILRPPPRRHRWVLVVVAVLVLAAAGAAAYAGLARHGTSAASSGSTTTAPAPATLTVVSTTPAAGTQGVPSDQPVSVHFSAALVAGVGLPAWNPPVAGTWVRSAPATLSFEAAAPFVPTTTETLTVPSGSSGPRTVHGAVLAAPDVVTFTVAQASTERLQQLLAELDYLPLSFTPQGAAPAPAQLLLPQAGAFAWRWTTLPPDLTSLWTEGTENVITKGAVMTFESDHGLTVDGVAGHEVWTGLMADAAAGTRDPHPYNNVLVSKQLPENLTVYSDGVPVLPDVPVNTGAPGADTVDGTYPVFEHVTSSRMTGTNPDGSHYDDPNVPWASYFNG
ncbi:MAG: Ig-like domain-containing protein, partial [Acidimicrobiales bacterium]|nr:Ig-like domain-containing protein [Acidimicrobiales bacterium]